MTKLLYFVRTWLSTSHPFNHLIFTTTHKAVIIIFILHTQKMRFRVKRESGWGWNQVCLIAHLGRSAAGPGTADQACVCMMLSFWVQTCTCKHAILGIMRVPMFI